MVECWSKSSSAGIPPQTVDYFYGRISRQDTENYLADGLDGLFLLRWCINHANGYGVAVYFQLGYGWRYRYKAAFKPGQHVAQTSNFNICIRIQVGNLYPDTYGYKSATCIRIHMLTDTCRPATSCSFGIHVDYNISATFYYSFMVDFYPIVSSNSNIRATNWQQFCCR